MSDNVSTAATAKVFVSYSKIVIKALGEVDYTDPPGYAPNGLVAAHLDAAAIFTGVHSGYVTVTVQTTTSAPRLEGVGSGPTWKRWCSPPQSRTCACSDSWATPPARSSFAHPPGAGVYSLRVHASTAPVSVLPKLTIQSRNTSSARGHSRSVAMRPSRRQRICPT